VWSVLERIQVLLSLEGRKGKEKLQRFILEEGAAFGVIEPNDSSNKQHTDFFLGLSE